MSISNTMRAVILNEYNGILSLSDIPIPKPSPGQVLVKMEASPIHPADFSFIKGQYGVKRTLPTIPGTEGSGLVIENGGGIMGWNLKGSRVAVVSTEKSTGTWAEYMVADCWRCIPLPNDVTYEEGAFAVGNPLTVLGFYDIVEKMKANAVIQTAGCSAVGRMVSKYLTFKGIKVINVVRRKEQEEILINDGVELVLNSNDNDFKEKLNEMMEKIKPTCFFDSVAGKLTGIILKAMQKNSKVYIYGMLSKEDCEIDGRDLRYNNKSIEGFWLAHWIKGKGLIGQTLLLSHLKSILKTHLKTNISKIISIDEINQGIDFYRKNMSLGKVLIRFGKDSIKKGDEIISKKEIIQPNEEIKFDK